MKIEDTIFESGLPVNSKAMLNRMRELLDEGKTNCLVNIKDDRRVLQLMWLINSQVFGGLAMIDMMDLWGELEKGIRKIQEV